MAIFYERQFFSELKIVEELLTASSASSFVYLGSY